MRVRRQHIIGQIPRLDGIHKTLHLKAPVHVHRTTQGAAQPLEKNDQVLLLLGLAWVGKNFQLFFSTAEAGGQQKRTEKGKSFGGPRCQRRLPDNERAAPKGVAARLWCFYY
jgi:hypothetical protein